MYFDPRFKRLLWYLIGTTKGGVTRARILEMLNFRPSNTNQIASELRLDYKTVVHHLEILSKNGLVITDNKDEYLFLNTPDGKELFCFSRDIVKN